jgi:hypothetical protein
MSAAKRKISIQLPKITPQWIRNEENNKAIVSRSSETIEVSAEINGTQTRKAKEYLWN